MINGNNLRDKQERNFFFDLSDFEAETCLLEEEEYLY